MSQWNEWNEWNEWSLQATSSDAPAPSSVAWNEQKCANEWSLEKNGQEWKDLQATSSHGATSSEWKERRETETATALTAAPRRRLVRSALFAALRTDGRQKENEQAKDFNFTKAKEHEKNEKENENEQSEDGFSETFLEAQKPCRPPTYSESHQHFGHWDWTEHEESWEENPGRRNVFVNIYRGE